MSNDVAKFDTATGFVHDIWKGLIELVVLGFFIYKQIGISGLFGIAFLLSFIPLQGKHRHIILVQSIDSWYSNTIYHVSYHNIFNYVAY